eukprot:2843026-Rhodomonas_salina.1
MSVGTAYHARSSIRCGSTTMCTPLCSASTGLRQHMSACKRWQYQARRTKRIAAYSTSAPGTAYRVRSCIHYRARRQI